MDFWEVYTDPDVIFSLLLTLKTTLIALIGFLIVAPGLGWLLARRPNWAVRALGFIVTLPLVFPPIALGYLLLVLLGRHGLIGAAFYNAGIPIIFSSTAVALAGFIAGLPLVIRPLQAAFGSERLIELEEAARVHGASEPRIFLGITMPLIRPSLAAGLLLGCARITGEVGITMMLGGNIAGRTNTLSLEIFNAVGRADYDVANALCVVLVITAVLLFIAMETIMKRSIKL